MDLGFQGCPFTFGNKQRGCRNVKVQLDRAIADNKRRDIFTIAKLIHEASPCSDNLPFVLTREVDGEKIFKPKIRCCEILWERDASLPERIAMEWEKAGDHFSLGDIRAGLRNLLCDLHTWECKRFGNVSRELEKSRSRLEELLNMNAGRGMK